MRVNEDPRYGSAAVSYCLIPCLRMYQAMIANGFTEEEALNAKFQSRVRNREEYKQLIVEKRRKRPGLLRVDIQQENDEVSALTGTATIESDATSTCSESDSPPLKDGPITRSITKKKHLQKQKEREASRALKKRKAEALNDATMQYQREVEKEHFQFASPKKSARTIAQATSKKYGAKVCHQSILRNIKEGIVGQPRPSQTGYPIVDNSRLSCLKKEKKRRMELARIDAAARELLSKKIAPSDFTRDQVLLLLDWLGIDEKDIPKTNLKGLQKWFELKTNLAPPSVPKWTLEDEAEIAKLEAHDVGHTPQQAVMTVDEFMSWFGGQNNETQLKYKPLYERVQKQRSTSGVAAVGPLCNSEIDIRQGNDELSILTWTGTIYTQSTVVSSETSFSQECDPDAPRRSPRSIAQERLEKQKEREALRKRNEILNEATMQYHLEIEKENFQFSGAKRSVSAIAKEIGLKHGTEVCESSILRNIEEGLIGQSTPMPGGDCEILIERNNSDLQKLDALKKEKKRRVEIGRMDTAARGLLSKNIPPKALKKDQLVLLLQWHGIDTTDIKTNPKRLKKWLKLKDTAPPSVPKWTLEDEAEIAKLESPDIHMIVNPVCYEAWREDDWLEKVYGHLL